MVNTNYSVLQDNDKLIFMFQQKKWMYDWKEKIFIPAQMVGLYNNFWNTCTEIECFPVQHPNSHLIKLQQRQKKGFLNLLLYSLKATKDQP